MSTFTRKCRACTGTGKFGPDARCEECAGTGTITKPITITVQIAVDNRPATPFKMIVHPNGRLEFKKKGHKRSVETTIQHAFNRARMAAAIEAKPKRIVRKVKRGLIALGGNR